MAVLSKEEHKRLEKELYDRFHILLNAFTSRELKSPKEGTLRKGTWRHPDTMCATVASTDELKLAVSDFRTILTRLHQLK